MVGGVVVDVAWDEGGGIGIRCVLHPIHPLLQQTHNKRGGGAEGAVYPQKKSTKEDTEQTLAGVERPDLC